MKNKKNKQKTPHISTLEQDSIPQSTSRRSFLYKILLALGVVAIAELIVILANFLKPRKRPGQSEEFGSLMVAGTISDFPLKSVTAFARGHFFLARLEDGGFLAYSRRCTHLGCTITWNQEEGRFLCPCHSSSFDIKGNVINPPAPRALDLCPVIIENKTIKVDTGKFIQRKRFNSSQVKKPQVPKNWVEVK